MTKSTTPLRPLDLKRFTFDVKRGTLTAEASDFGPARDGLWWLDRLYPDACDLGIAIRSHYTGREERFYLEKEETNEEGEVLAWRFRPLNKLSYVERVTIYND